MISPLLLVAGLGCGGDALCHEPVHRIYALMKNSMAWLFYYYSIGHYIGTVKDLLKNVL